MEMNTKQGKKRRNRRIWGPWRTWRKLPVLAAAVLVLGLGARAEARDGGGEEVVPINAFRCVACDALVYTFAPDSLVLPGYDHETLAKAVQLKTHGTPEQQKQFDVFYEKFFKTSREKLRVFRTLQPLDRCDAPYAGGYWKVHIFRPDGGTRKWAPMSVHNQIMVGSGFALSTYDRQLYAAYDRWECVVCRVKFKTFQGDDLNLYPPVEYEKPMKMFLFGGSSHLRPCSGLRWANDSVPVQHHMLKKTGHGTINNALQLRNHAMDNKEYFFSE